jgi:hypothetical protein
MRKLTVVAFLLTGLSSLQVFAQIHRGVFQSTKVGATLTSYTGPANTSFSEGSPGHGMEFSIDSGSGFLRYYYRARVNASLGSQNFIKSGTKFFTDYDFYSIEPEIGVDVYPVHRNERGLNIYLWGSGNLSYNYLDLKTVPSTVKVDPKSQSLGYGFGGGIGFELIMHTTKSGKRIMIYSELGFREGIVPLAGQSAFEVSGLTASLGFGF